MRDFSGKTFEEAFGWTGGNEPNVIHPHKNRQQNRGGNNKPNQRQIQRMTPTQKRWFSLMFPQDSRQELICFLKRENRAVLSDGVRHSDFAAIEEYLIGAEGAELTPCKGSLPVKGNWNLLHGYVDEGYYWFNWRFSNSNRANACEICVDTSCHLRMVTPKELVNLIKKSIKNSGPRLLRQLEKDDETIQNELTNSDDKVFIYELLQNANDYPYQCNPVRVEIRLDDKCLCFRHTGKTFSALNVNALCSAGEGEKSANPNAIGYKGIGFKTVFKNNPRVYLNSGEFNFWFDRDRTNKEVRLGAPWRRVPLWDDDFPVDMGEYRVGFKLYPETLDLLRRDNAKGYAGILREMFRDERVLLFIPEVCEAKIIISQEEKWTVQKSGANWCVSNLAPVELSKDIRCDIEKQVTARNIPPKLKGKEKTQVSFACRLSGKRLVEIENSCLYCFLPAEKAQWGFKFLMNTDMVPNGSRDDVRYDLELNANLSRIAGAQFCVWINQLIRSGYDYDSVFGLIPDFELCVAGKTEKVAALIKEFKQGFESKLSTLQIPSDSGELVPIKEIVYDATGVIEKLGVSFWKRLNQKGFIACESLLGSDDFKSFIERYKTDLEISEFGFAELFRTCKSLLEPQESSDLQAWMLNPHANNQFIDFLWKSKKLIEFSSLPIFLDNSGKLGCAASMYKYSDDLKYLEKCLPEFVGMARFLSPKVNYHDRKVVSGHPQVLEGVKFKGFGPRTFLFEVVLARGTGPIYEETRKKLKDIEVSKRFWSYIAHYRLWDGKQRFEGDYLLLSKLPFVDENGLAVDSFVSDAYSVYIREESSDEELVKAKWCAAERVRIINPEYFSGEEGEEIKKFFCDGKAFKNSSRLAYRFNVRDCYLPLAVKFKDQVKAQMLSMNDDLGFYDYLSRCFADEHISHDKMKMRFSGFPVIDTTGQLTDKIGKPVFYYTGELCSWMRNGWLDKGAFVILTPKYSSQKALFNLFGTKEFADGSFGELFKNYFASKLLLDTPEKVIAFHNYMATKRTLISENQASGLKNASVLLLGHEGVAKGLDGVYIAQQYDAVATLVESGALSRDIKVLDSRLCVSEDMLKYWEWLGCKKLDSDQLVEEKIRKYLSIQSSNTNVDEFKSIHKEFIREIIAAGGLESKLKGVLLYDEQGDLVNPDTLVLGTRYNPACDFQGHGVSYHYVSKVYLDLVDDDDRVKSFLRGLGVREDFTKEDVGCLSEISFCKYFWHDYVKKNEAVREKFHEWITPDSKCVLDRAGNVRAPKELYDVGLADYVNALQDHGAKLPDADVISGLGFKQQLGIVDCLDFLLTNPSAKMRGRVLVWLAQGKIGVEEQAAIAKYRENPNAIWTNGRGEEGKRITELVAISHSKSRSKASIFSTDERVLRTSGLGINGEMWEDAEKAFSMLGVPVVDDDDIEVCPVNPKDKTDIVREIAVRLLVFLMSREGDEGLPIYDEKYKALAALEFVQCESISVKFKDVLQNNQRKFMSDGDRLCYVEDWQSKYVYGDIVKKLSDKLFHGAYSDDDLKVAFDTDGGHPGLARRIVQDFCLHKNDAFMSKLEEVSLQLKHYVEDIAKAGEGIGAQANIDSNVGQNGDDGNSMAEQPSEEGSTGQELNSERGDEGDQDNVRDARRERLEHKYGTLEDEDYALLKLIDSGLTEDEAQDQSKIACIRLFRYLEKKGLKPSMYGSSDPEFVIKTLYSESRDRKGPNIDISNGKTIHVISAMGGIMHLPPKWWNSMTEQFDGTKEICIMYGAREGEFKFIREHDDIQKLVADNAILVKVSGVDAQERMDLMSAMFGDNRVSTAYGKVYGLIKMRSLGEVLDRAFINKILETTDEESRRDEPFSLNEYD